MIRLVPSWAVASVGRIVTSRSSALAASAAAKPSALARPHVLGRASIARQRAFHKLAQAAFQVARASAEWSTPAHKGGAQEGDAWLLCLPLVTKTLQFDDSRSGLWLQLNNGVERSQLGSGAIPKRRFGAALPAVESRRGPKHLASTLVNGPLLTRGPHFQ